MKNIFTPRFITLSLIVLIAAITRLIPHAPNFTPIAAIALFGGANFNSKWAAFLVPLSAMFLSDLFIGFYGVNMIAVYISFALIALIGTFISKNQGIGSIATATISSSLMFFVVTNFAVWMGNPAYPQTFSGLLECYYVAIPFYNNSLMGDLFYSSILFGGFYFARLKFPALAK